MQRSWYVVAVAAALMLLATGPVAAQPTAGFYLNSPGSGANLAGVYTSPYTGQINSGPTIPVICDDFADDSYVPETWTAYVTQLSSLLAGTDPYTSDLKWQSGWNGSTSMSALTLTQVQAYTVAEVLAVDILTSPTGSQLQEDLSYALWGLFDPLGTAGDPGAFAWLSSYGLNNGPGSDGANALSELTGAVALASNQTSLNTFLTDHAVENVTIYSYDTGAAGACGGPCTAPQEFINVRMAEPPSPALLGLDLLAVGGLIFFVRRRRVASV